MPLDNIISKILQDANTQAGARMRDASLKAAEIINKAKDDSDELKKRLLDEAGIKAKAEMERAYISKALEIKKEILKKKHELMDKAFEEAFKEILKLDSNTYSGAIETVICSNVKADEEAEIQFCENDKPLLNKNFIDMLNSKKGLKLRMGPYLNIADKGFIMRKDKVIIDSTFSKGIKFLKERSQFQISKILFE